MIFKNKAPREFEIRPGSPWTINGQPSEATDPRAALEEIYDQAERFPVRIDVITGETPEDIISLEMDNQGQTTPVETEDSSDHEDLTESLMDDEEEAQPSSSELERQRRIRPLWVVVPVAALVLLGGGVFALNNFTHDKATADATSESSAGKDGVKIPSGQKGIALIGDHAVTLEGNKVRILDAATGKQIGDPVTTEAADKIRTQHGDASDAVDLGDGHVLLIKDGEVKELDGQLNGRGDAPVIVNDKSYTTAKNQTEKIPSGKGVLSATSDGVVLASSPHSITINDHDVELKAPEDGAKLTKWVQATDESVAVVWDKDGKSRLSFHDIDSGEERSHLDVKPDQIKVSRGVVWLSDTSYLAGEKKTDLCAGGVQVSSQIFCPDGSSWKNPETGLRVEKRPDAVSDTYLMTDNTITKEEDHK